GHGAVLVVGQRFDQHGDATGAVTFVEDFLEGATFGATQRALDGAVDVVDRHVAGFGGRQRVLRRQVGASVPASTAPDSPLDGTDVLADDLAALAVVDRLLALDLRPFAVTCQRCFPFAGRAWNVRPSTLSFYLTPRCGGSADTVTAAEGHSAAVDGALLVPLGACGGPCGRRRWLGSADGEVGFPDVPEWRRVDLDRDGARPFAVTAATVVDDGLVGPDRRERGAHAVEATWRGRVVGDALFGGGQHDATARHGDVAREDVDAAIGIDGAERDVARVRGLDQELDLFANPVHGSDAPGGAEVG